MNTRKIAGKVRVENARIGTINLNVAPDVSAEKIRQFLALAAIVTPSSFDWGSSASTIKTEILPPETEVPKKFRPTPTEKNEPKPEVSERTPTPIFKKGSEPAAGTLMFIVLSAVRSVPLATLTLVRNRYFQISRQPVNSNTYASVSALLSELIKRGLVQRVSKGVYKAV